MKPALFLPGLLLSVALFSCQKDRERVDVFINDINIPDLQTGEIIPHQYVAIKNGSILETGGQELAEKYTAPEWLEGKGFYLIPGLWDNHVHFGGADYIDENINLLDLYLAMGITTVRDAAGDISSEVLKWRDEINLNKRIGPRIFTSGPKIEGKGSIWPGDLEVDNEEELINAFDSLEKLKVDFIKITDNALKPELFVKAISLAKSKGYPVSGHIPAALSLEQVSRKGLTTIEHLSYALKGVSPDENMIMSKEKLGEISTNEASLLRINSLDKETALQNFKKLAASGTGIVPTLNISRLIAYLDQDNHKNDTLLKYIGPKLKASYQWRVDRAMQDDSIAILERHYRFENTAKLLPLLKEAGVTILAGTDAGYLNSYNYPGQSLHQELEWFTHYGLSPAEALKTSVVNGPAYFGLLNDYGAVSKDKVADLVILSANPLVDISNTQKIQAVIRKGVFYDRNQLNEMLKRVKKGVEEKERVIKPL